MENKEKKRIDIKKIISIILCITVISIIICISAFATTILGIDNNIWYYFNDNQFESPNNSTANTLNVSGKLYKISDDTEIEFTSFQIARNSGGGFHWVELVFDNQGQTSILVTNNTKSNYRVMFYNIESVNTSVQTSILHYINKYVPPIDPYTPTSDFLEWILNDTTTILGFMISNSVLLLVICIVIVSLSIGIIKRLTNNKF